MDVFQFNMAFAIFLADQPRRFGEQSNLTPRNGSLGNLKRVLLVFLNSIRRANMSCNGVLDLKYKLLPKFHKTRQTKIIKIFRPSLI